MSEADLDALEALLAAVAGDEEPLPLDAVHGCLTALVITGKSPRRGTWLTWVLGSGRSRGSGLDASPYASPYALH